MRWPVIAGMAILALQATACGHCSCGGTGFGVEVLLKDADVNSVVAVSGRQRVGVELSGSDRTITSSDPGRMSPSGSFPQPAGMTVRMFTPNWVKTADGLEQFGGTLRLSAPAQGSHDAWRVTLIVDTHPLGLSALNVVTVGQSWIYRWPAGGVGPTSSDTRVLAAAGPAVPVTAAYGDLRTPGLSTGETWLQQLFYAAAPGKAFAADPHPQPTMTNEEFGSGSEFIVKMNPDWSCSVESGCRQIVAGGSQAPDQGYGVDVTPPPS